MPETWYVLEVTQTPFIYTHQIIYHEDKDMRRIKVPTDKNRYYPEQLCNDAENLRNFLSNLGILSAVKFKNERPRSFEQILFYKK